MPDLSVIAQAKSPAARPSGGAGRTAFTDSQSREEMRSFLQQRLASFGLLLALTFGMFLAWRKP